MADDSDETKDNSIPVEADEDLGESEEKDLGEQIEEVQSMIGGLDPDNVAVLGVVAVTKESYETPHGEDADGFEWRVFNHDLGGYDDARQPILKAASFNDGLDTLEVPMETPTSNPLDALMGE